MNEQRTRAVMKVAVRILVALSVSAVSLVIAQRVLTGFDASVDGMPVVRGHVDDENVEVVVVPEWQGDAAVTLHYDDGTAEDAFGRRVEGELVITTIEHGTEPLEDFLARLGLVSNEFVLASACELMRPDDAVFEDACAAYDPRRRPTDHPDVAGEVCSTCHLPNEIEEAYERSQAVVLAVGADTVAGPDRATPAGHVEVQGKACSTCHAVAGDDLPAVPVGDSSGRPPGHPDVASGSCATCHGGSGDTPGADAPSPDQPRPPGHPDVAAGSCATCHGGTGDTPTTPALPDDHPSTRGQACTSCHDSPTGPTDDDAHDDDYEDERDEDDEDEEDEEDEEDDYEDDD